MPYFERPNARIYYEEQGSGPALLLIAPGGLRSSIAKWAGSGWDLAAEFQSRFRVITMDQRNAGNSSARVSANDGWADYTADQLGLMDHLGIDRFGVLGMCIGGTYAIRLARAAPDRVTSAVLMQPIGLHENRSTFFDLFDAWAAEIAAKHPHMSESDWHTFRERMLGGDFLFGASRDDVKTCKTPLLVFLGNDIYHPASVSRAVADNAPNARLIEEWKSGAHREHALVEIAEFLRSHAEGP